MKKENVVLIASAPEGYAEKIYPKLSFSNGKATSRFKENAS